MENYKKWHVAGALSTLCLGTLLHFAFQWSGESPLIGAVAPVNESTWEHLKLLFTPLLLSSLAGYFLWGRRTPGFAMARFLSVLAGMGLITAGFYTYSGIVGRNFLVADIALFFAGTALAYFLSARFTSGRRFCSAGPWGWVGLLALLAVFCAFTFFPPQIGLFFDPPSGGYGIISTFTP